MFRWKTAIIVAAGLGRFLVVRMLSRGFGAVGGK